MAVYTETRISIFEVDDEEVEGVVMSVSNHWIEKAKVVIEVADHRYTVSAEELVTAIENGTNR